MTSPTKTALMQEVVNVADHLVKMWGTGNVGVNLLLRYFGDTPWVTADELAAGTPLSAAQVRRRLTTLASLGRVRTRKRGRRVEYMADPHLAEQSYARIAVTFTSFAFSNMDLR